MPSLKVNKLRNDDLQKRIEMSKNENDEKRKLAKFNIRPPLVKQPCVIPKFHNNKVRCKLDNGFILIIIIKDLSYSRHSTNRKKE